MVLYHSQDTWINKFFQGFLIQSYFGHVSFLVKFDDSYEVFGNLTEAGVEFGSVLNYEELDDVLEYQVVQCRNISKFVEQAGYLQDLGLRYSHWYVVDALFQGCKFGALNCASFVSVLLFCDTKSYLPELLFQRLKDEDILRTSSLS